MYGIQPCDNQITICTAQGRLTFPEIQSQVIDFSTRQVTRRVLCDLSRATVADLTASELEEIIKLISRQIAGRNGGKAAIIARAGVDYGLARMFGTFAEIADLPIKVRVFRTAEIATQWLQEPPGS